MPASFILSLFSKRHLLPDQTIFIKLKNQQTFKNEYRELVRTFKDEVRRRKTQTHDVAHDTKKHSNTSTSSNEAVSFAYDKEYAGQEPNYAYLSPILLPSGFTAVTGYDLQNVPMLKILDVGAGSNEFLRFCHKELGVPKANLYGTDISQESVNIIKRDGFNGHLGRIEQISLIQHSFDLIFLSYFIDYDTDQAATFRSAVNLVRSGGKIIIEGWFPVRPFALRSSNMETFTFVTKGKNKFDDTILILKYFQEFCLSKGYTARLEQVSEGTRYVHSRHGFKKLPSWFLTLEIQKKNPL